MNIHISNRLKKMVHYIPKDSCFADIGSDHALLPCYVCLHDKTANAIAGEVQEGPYKRAIENVKRFELEQQIEVRLGDGLEVVDHRVDTIIISGMGGNLISEILTRGEDKLIKVNKLILQPNNHTEHVRKTLINLNFNLSSEVIIEENKQIYEILIADKKQLNPYDNNCVKFKKQIMFGPYLLEEKQPVFIKYWHSEYEKLKKVVSSIRQSKSNQDSNLTQFKKKISLIEEVLNE